MSTTIKSNNVSNVKMQIPVRMGSNCFKIDSVMNPNFKLTSSELVELALKKCKISSTNEQITKTYSVYESCQGVERLLRRSEDVLDACKSWSKKQTEFEFVIRKSNRMEIKIKKQVNSQKQQKIVKKCFKKLGKIQIEEHRESIPEDNQTKDESVLTNFDSKTHNNGLKSFSFAKNTNTLFQSLYLKLKQQNKQKYFNTSSNSASHLIFKDINSCGNSSDETQSITCSNSRSNSSSSLESLI